MYQKKKQLSIYLLTVTSPKMSTNRGAFRVYQDDIILLRYIFVFI
jgi:hypothetical protein